MLRYLTIAWLLPKPTSPAASVSSSACSTSSPLTLTRSFGPRASTVTGTHSPRGRSTSLARMMLRQKVSWSLWVR